MKNILNAWSKQNSAGGHSLNKWKPEVLEKWQQSEYPKGEDWKYVRYGSLVDRVFHWPESVQASQIHISEENIEIDIRDFGDAQSFSSVSLPKGMHLLTRQEAFAKGLISSEIEAFGFENPFYEMGTSLITQGFFIHWDKSFQDNKRVKVSLDLDSLKGTDLACGFQFNFVSESQVHPEIYLDVKANGFKGLSNVTVHCDVAARSGLKLYSMEQGGASSHLVFNLLGRVQEAGHLECLDISFPSLWSRHNVDIRLLEKGAETTLHGAYFNNENYFCDHHTLIQHCVGDTQSREDYRGILSGSAQAVFNGKIKINEKASGSHSEQVNKNLMLSRSAEVDTKPELQIYNDDVKAAHGATVGQLDADQLFYLQSRGFSPKLARQVLSRAFVYGLLDGHSEAAQGFFREAIEKCLDQLQEEA